MGCDAMGGAGWDATTWDGMRRDGMECDGMRGRDGMRQDGMECDGMRGRDGMRQHGMECDGMRRPAQLRGGLRWGGMGSDGVGWGRMGQVERERAILASILCERNTYAVGRVGILCERGTYAVKSDMGSDGIGIVGARSVGMD